MATPTRRRTARKPTPPARTARTTRTTPKAQPTEPQPARKSTGRPPGPPSTIVNIRIPVALLARLDRYIDLLARPGAKANRATVALRALADFLDTHAPDSTRP